MKHYKNKENKVYAFEEDGSQDSIITEDLIPVSSDELKILLLKARTEKIPDKLNLIIVEEIATIESIKSRRNSLLAKSDWTQLSDIPSDTRAKWVQYRQDLRDITNQEGLPENVIWPAQPV